MTLCFVFRTIGLALLAMAIGVLCVVLWVALYSEVIAPGLGEPYYRAYADRVAPMIGIVTGMPLLLAAGWLAARKAGGGAGWRSGIAVGIAYVIIDLPLLAMVAGGAIPWGYVALSYVTKIAAAALGGRASARQSLVSV